VSDVSDVQPETPPAGEEIHLPGPSVLPITAAAALTLIVIGTTIDWIWSILGLIILVVVVIRWIRDTRREVSTLPEEHH